MSDLSIPGNAAALLTDSAKEFLDALDARDTAKTTYELLLLCASSLRDLTDAARDVIEAEKVLQRLRAVHKPYRRELDPTYGASESFGLEYVAPDAPPHACFSSACPVCLGTMDNDDCYGIYSEEEYHDNRQRLRDL